MRAAPATQLRPAPFGPPVVLGLLAAGGAVLLTVVNPNTTRVPLCPWKAFTGLDCPFCGSLRAVHAVTQGDIAGAAGHNLAFMVAAPFLVLAWLRWMRRARNGHTDGPMGDLAVPRWALWAAVAALGLFTVVRNLPVGHWLAST